MDIIEKLKEVFNEDQIVVLTNMVLVWNVFTREQVLGLLELEPEVARSRIDEFGRYIEEQERHREREMYRLLREKWVEMGEPVERLSRYNRDPVI